MNLVILRLGHRYGRDNRMTTHIFLTARAFGANKVIYSGKRDKKLEARIDSITKMWGGPFKVEYRRKEIAFLREWMDKGGEIIHLTMYGLPIQSVIKNIRKSSSDKLIVVGGAKVPKLFFEASTWNVAVTAQPHSEVSALSIFLHEFFNGQELLKIFENAKVVIIPQARGKKIVKT